MKAAIERQVFVTWYTPEEKLPEDDTYVVATVSGKIGNVRYDHAMMMATYYHREGWCFDGIETEEDMDKLTVHAWCDLEPYGG